MADEHDHDDDRPGPPAGRSRGVREVNQMITGELRDFFPERDVVLTVDADAALRLIACWAGDVRFEDRLDPNRTLGVNSWVGIDVRPAVAIVWNPTLEVAATSGSSRVTVDPV